MIFQQESYQLYQQSLSIFFTDILVAFGKLDSLSLSVSAQGAIKLFALGYNFHNFTV